MSERWVLYAYNKAGEPVEVLVDEDVLHACKRFRWRVDYNGYVFRKGSGKRIMLHRVVAGPAPPEAPIIDHKNRNPLDNRRENLRFATPLQSAQNRGRSRKARTPFKGVKQVGDRFQAAMCVQGKRRVLGVVHTAEEAALAYDRAAIAAFGKFAAPNYPDSCGS